MVTIVIRHYLVKLTVLFVVLVHFQLIEDPQAEQEAAGQAGGQAQQVEQCELTVFEQIAPCEAEICLKHEAVIIGSRVRKRCRNGKELMVNKL